MEQFEMVAMYAKYIFKVEGIFLETVAMAEYAVQTQNYWWL